MRRLGRGLVIGAAAVVAVALTGPGASAKGAGDLVGGTATVAGPGLASPVVVRGPGLRRMLEQPLHGRGDGSDVSGWHAEAAARAFNQLAEPREVGADDGDARCHELEELHRLRIDSGGGPHECHKRTHKFQDPAHLLFSVWSGC